MEIKDFRDCIIINLLAEGTLINSASSAKRGSENSNIVCKDIPVLVKGLPIADIPFFRMPDPSVDHESGLHMPCLIPLDLSSVPIITPYFSFKTNTLEYRYRKNS